MRREPAAALGLIDSLFGSLLFILAATVPGGVAADPLFAAPFLSYDTGGSFASSVAIADFDHDGRSDLVVAHEGEPGTGFQPITVFLANPDGTFRKFHEVRAGWGPTEIACHDLDGDGHADLAVADGGGAALLVLRGLGDGRFAGATTYRAGWGSVSVAVGDLVGDSSPDLVVANWHVDTLSLFRGLGNGTFAAPTEVAVAGHPYAVRTGDLNGDGQADLAVTCTEIDAISVLIREGDGVFAAPVALPAGTHPASLAVSDLNGDGHLDLASADALSSSVSVFLGNGDGSFLPRRVCPVGDSYANDRPWAVAAGDVNGDANPDLAVAAERNVWILLGIGDGSFRDAARFAVGLGQSGGERLASIAVGDLDGDSRPDLAATTWRWIASIVVLPGNGDGSFGRGRRLETPGSTRSVAAGDVDGDGWIDLAAAHGTETGTVSLYLGDGNAGFQDGASLAAGVMPSSIFLGELDHDQHSDLLVANDNLYFPDPYAVPLRPNALSLFGGHGDGSFEPRREIAIGHRTANVASADLNADGSPDLVVPGGDVSRLTILLGRGDGTFAAAPDVALDYPPGPVAIGDMDGDGIPDCVVGNPWDDVRTVLIGAGDGTFPIAFYSPAPSISGLALADIDGDLHLDVIEFGYSTVTVLRGSGNGLFNAVQKLSLWYGPLSGAVGDLDDDGWVDVVVADHLAGKVSVLLGDRAGGLMPKQDFGTGYGLQHVVLSDLNGDSRPEIVAACYDVIRVLVNRGPVISTPVAVQDFAGEVLDGAVVLGWRLAGPAERPLQGIHVQRASVEQGPFTTITSLALEPGADSYRDNEVEAGRDYWYRLALVLAGGAQELTAPILVNTAANAGARTLLLQAFETTDGGSVTIRYHVAVPGTPVDFTLFDPRGRCLWSVPRTAHPAGDHMRIWDRRDRAGAVAARGVYILRMRAGSMSVSRKVLLLCR